MSIDQFEQTIAFHEHGPSQPASFTVLCKNADILLPDMTDYGADTSVSIKNALVEGGHLHLDVAFQFKTADELWRTALTLSSICAGVVGKYAEASSLK